MGRLYLQYLHEDYILICKGCSTHLALINDKGCQDIIRLNHNKSGFKPKKVVNCKLERGAHTPFSNGHSIDIKCISCLEIVGKVEKQLTSSASSYASLLFNGGLNPEDTATRVFQPHIEPGESPNVIDIDCFDVKQMTLLMSKVSVKRATPEVTKPLTPTIEEEPTTISEQ